MVRSSLRGLIDDDVGVREKISAATSRAWPQEQIRASRLPMISIKRVPAVTLTSVSALHRRVGLLKMDAKDGTQRGRRLCAARSALGPAGRLCLGKIRVQPQATRVIMLCREWS